jgi:C-terminal processing protease CtpA/Prc
VAHFESAPKWPILKCPPTFGREDLIRYLFENGVDYNAKCKNGASIIDVAITTKQDWVYNLVLNLINEFNASKTLNFDSLMQIAKGFLKSEDYNSAAKVYQQIENAFKQSKQNDTMTTYRILNISNLVYALCGAGEYTEALKYSEEFTSYVDTFKAYLVNDTFVDCWKKQVSSSRVRSFLAQGLIEDAKKERGGGGYLGFGFAQSDSGMSILEVFPNSPAAYNGLHKGDVIISFNGTILPGITNKAFGDLLNVIKPGTYFDISLIRNKEVIHGFITMGIVDTALYRSDLKPKE